MKNKNILLYASVLGLATYFLPVISEYGGSVSPSHEAVAEFLDAPSQLFMFLVWYGSFVLSLPLSLWRSGNLLANRLRLGVLIVLNLFGMFIHTILVNELIGHGSLGFGAILFYLAALVIIGVSVLQFKASGITINTEDLKKAGEKGLAIGKATADIATKVAKTAVKEAKKEIEKQRTKGEE